MQQCVKLVQVRLSLDEYEILRERASKEKRSMSNYLRIVGTGKAQC